MSDGTGSTGSADGTGGLVVGVDGSRPAEVALDWALAEARARGVPLTVVHAWDKAVGERVRHAHATTPAHAPEPADVVGTAGAAPADVEPRQPEGTEEALAQERTFVRSLVDDALARRPVPAGAPDVPVRTRQVHGSPADALLQVAADEGAAMVVVGRRGHGRLSRLVLGSVSNAVVQDAALPVTVVPVRAAADAADAADTTDTADTSTDTGGTGGAAGAPRVVVGVDGSALSVRALREGGAVAGRLGGTLDAVFCWQLSTLSPLPESWGWVPPLDDYEAWAAQALGEALAAAALDLPADHVRRDVRHAPPAPGLVEAAAGADRVVVGSRGLGGFERLVLGSVSRQLLEAAPCPVTVVRG